MRITIRSLCLFLLLCCRWIEGAEPGDPLLSKPTTGFPDTKASSWLRADGTEKKFRNYGYQFFLSQLEQPDTEATGGVLYADASGNPIWKFSDGRTADLSFQPTISDLWMINAGYPNEILNMNNVNLSMDFGTTKRFFVQGYGAEAWSDYLVPNLTDAGASYRAAHLFTNLPELGGGYLRSLFDHGKYSSAWGTTAGGTFPAGSYYIAYKFDTPKQVNRVSISRFGAWKNPFDTFTMWGSDNSTNGVDGAWTQISTSFTISTDYGAVTNYDFTSNTMRFTWAKMVAGTTTQPRNTVAWLEVDFRSYTPEPDKSFWVDSNGNPGTDGFFVFKPMAAPAAPEEGTVYQDSTTHKLRCWNGSAWNDLW